MPLALAMPISEMLTPSGIRIRGGRMTEERIYFTTDGWHLGKGPKRVSVQFLRGTIALLALSVYVCLIGERVIMYIRQYNYKTESFK